MSHVVVYVEWDKNLHPPPPPPPPPPCKFRDDFGDLHQMVVRSIADTGSLLRSGPTTFMEIDHEIFSNVILFFPVIQEGILSVTSNTVYTKYA